MDVGVPAGLGAGMGGIWRVSADMGQGWQRWAGPDRSDFIRQGWVTYLAVGCGCAYRSGIGWMWVCQSRYTYMPEFRQVTELHQ